MAIRTIVGARRRATQLRREGEAIAELPFGSLSTEQRMEARYRLIVLKARAEELEKAVERLERGVSPDA